MTILEGPQTWKSPKNTKSLHNLKNKDDKKMWTFPFINYKMKTPPKTEDLINEDDIYGCLWIGGKNKEDAMSIWWLHRQSKAYSWLESKWSKNKSHWCKWYGSIQVSHQHIVGGGVRSILLILERCLIINGEELINDNEKEKQLLV